jgi:hypothetical protein
MELGYDSFVADADWVGFFQTIDGKKLSVMLYFGFKYGLANNIIDVKGLDEHNEEFKLEVFSPRVVLLHLQGSTLIKAK